MVIRVLLLGKKAAILQLVLRLSSTVIQVKQIPQRLESAMMLAHLFVLHSICHSVNMHRGAYAKWESYKH